MPIQRWKGAALLTTLSVLAVGGGATLFDAADPGARAQSQSNAVAPISAAVTTVQQFDVPLWQDFSGRLEPVEAVDVRARVSGAISAIHFVEGSLVQQGDLLVEIDPEPYRAEVERLGAQVAAAEARVRFTRAEADRADRLVGSNAISARDRDQRTNAAEEAVANLAMARAALRSAELALSYTQVRAPISGRIGRREITVGNLVDAGPNAPVLASILSVDPIYAAFEADQNTVSRALADIGGDRSRIGAIPVSAEFDGFAAPVEGSLQLVDNRVDARAGTVRLRATLSNPQGALTPGQFARVRLGRAQPEPSLLVPEEAIGTDQSRRFVLVLGQDNQTAYREVQLGQSLDGMRVVTSGLQPGERIVVSNLQRLRPGVQVEPRTTSMTADAR
ncbi:efflux RND transporter periplasmic adaptor subunit [Pseudochelatococcus sp. B33]